MAKNASKTTSGLLHTWLPWGTKKLVGRTIMLIIFWEIFFKKRKAGYFSLLSNNLSSLKMLFPIFTKLPFFNNASSVYMFFLCDIRTLQSKEMSFCGDFQTLQRELFSQNTISFLTMHKHFVRDLIDYYFWFNHKLQWLTLLYSAVSVKHCQKNQGVVTPST